MGKSIETVSGRDIDEIVPSDIPTSGPWRAWESPPVANTHHTYWYVAGGAEYFGDDGHGFCLSGFISPVNAHLLAASWEMREALKAFLYWNDHMVGKDALVEAITLSRAALAKAAGQ